MDSDDHPPAEADVPTFRAEVSRLSGYQVLAYGQAVALEFAAPVGIIELTMPAHTLAIASQGLAQADAAAEQLRGDAGAAFTTRLAQDIVGDPEVYHATSGALVVAFRVRQSAPVAIAMTPEQTDSLMRLLANARQAPVSAPTRN